MRPNLVTQKSKFGLRSTLVRTLATCWIEGMNEMHMLSLSSLSLLKMSINLNMFGFIMLNWIVGDEMDQSQYSY